MNFPHGLSAFPPVLAAAQNHDGRLELFVVGSGGMLWHRWQTQPNRTWSDWKSLDTRGRGFAGIAVTAEPAGLIQAPVLALDGKGQLGLYLRFSGSSHLYQYVLNGIDPSKQSDWGGYDLPFTTT